MTDIMETTTISSVKVDHLLSFLMTFTEGPQEAYALMIAVLHRLNADPAFNDAHTPLEIFCEEIAASLRSITGYRHQ